MGFFDFLKTKDKPTDQKPESGTSNGDLRKTQLVVELLQIPKEKRDDTWMHSFYENVPYASFICGSPQIITGPDGFPYFVLRTPETDKSFELVCINSIKDEILLKKGFGVALNPEANGVDWVFSYGDILNLHLNGVFLTKSDKVNLQNIETIKTEEEVLLAQPSESYLPNQTRAVLKIYLQSIGIARPMIIMIFRTVEGKIIQELAFNLFAEDFSNPHQLNARLNQISWFLPRHYIILSVHKNSDLAKKIMDL